MNSRRAHALERSQRAVHGNHGAAHAAVAHQKIAAETDPERRNVGPKLPQE